MSAYRLYQKDKYKALLPEQTNMLVSSSFLSNIQVLDFGLKNTVRTLLSIGRKVILVSDVPEIGYEVPRAYCVSCRFPTLMPIAPTVIEYNQRQRDVNIILEKLAVLPGVTLIRPETRMFYENGKVRIMADGELLYADADHLSTAGALYVEPVFDEVFKNIAASQKRDDLQATSRKSLSPIALGRKAFGL